MRARIEKRHVTKEAREIPVVRSKLLMITSACSDTHLRHRRHEQNACLKRVFDIQLSDNLSTQLPLAFTASLGILQTRWDL